MVIGIDFSKLDESEYFIYDKDKNEYILLDGAPPDIVEIYNEYKEICEEEKRTGIHIF